MGNDAIKGRAQSLLGLTVLARGDTERAVQLVIDGARANRRGGQRTSMAYSTDGLAAVAEGSSWDVDDAIDRTLEALATLG